MTPKKDKTAKLKKTKGKTKKKPTLLFVDYEIPQYDRYAGSRTNFMYLGLLVEMGFEVTFLPGDFRRVEPYSSELNQLGIETLDEEWYRDNWEDWLRKNGKWIDYVFFHKPDPTFTILPVVRKYTDAAIIYQCHDLHYLRLRRKAEVESNSAILEEADRYEKKENFIFENSDVLLVFSEVEEKFIRLKFPDKEVFTVPLFFYREVRDIDDDFSKRYDLLYVGSCSHTPNRDAVSWFCSEIFPLVQAEIPAITFNVIGADPPAEISSLHSHAIRILGRLSEEQLQGYYDRTRMMVVPLRFGAGVKGKIIETFYHGVPLVSTTIGLEGISGVEKLASAKDNPAEFAAEVVSLYRNTKKLTDLSRRGKQFVAENFTADKTAELLTGILSTARKERDRRIRAAIPDVQALAPPRLIAFYLPQYHPIPENDEWWGEGFTEWRNVSSAEPLFAGHYQPHVPADLGYYDLRVEETRIAQADLARKYGIEGFCYYHYWFHGQRLLERPMQDLLESGKPDFPFCICWANESWTRRWDGKDKKILMKQEYSAEDDLRHIKTLLPIFADKRYIRINGKPLFLVYRSENLPDPARTAKTWREQARKAGIGELYLCLVQSFVKLDPAEINFDAAVEFAPDWWNKGMQLKVDPKLFSREEAKLANVCNNNWIHSYQALADSMMDKPVPDYTWLRCVTPSWDNWARMKKGASIFLGSTPEKFKDWLSRAIDDTTSRLVGEERVVFINAWNEWAEGNHLEPDERFGHGYLEATRRALAESQLAADSRRGDASKEVRIGHYMGRLLNQNDELDEWERQIAQRDQQIEELINKREARVAERDRQIEEMLNSTSWRVTVPLRQAKLMLRAVKNLFSR